MAFDAGMLYAVLHEIRENCLGARVEKTYQPTKEEVLLLMRGKKVSIYLGSSCPRIAITQLVKDNPAVPPMFCMLLRKHLTGAVLLDVSQIGFDRVAKLTFSGYDEMGFRTEKILYAELMGKYGNLILTDAEQKILAVAKPVDFSDSEVRQLLPGLRYAPPAPPDKRNPLEETAEGFSEKLHTASPDKGAVKLITDFYGGTATDVAREIVFRAAGKTDATVGEIEEETFSRVFLNWFTALREYRLSPSVMRDGEKKPIAYGYAPFAHLSGLDNVEHKESLGALFDAFFEEKDRAERVRLRASDLVRTVSRIQAKLVKKLALQREECEKASHGEEQKHYGDLIIANIHLAKKGMTSLLATDYEKYPPRTEEVPLDPRLTPTQNAQKYYKLYTKAKTAAKITAEQAVLTQNELSYIESVDSFLEKAETEADLNEIREELYREGYVTALRRGQPQKSIKARPMEFVTSGGFTVRCGRNNLQNELLTFRMSDKDDIWFHAKGIPGSHVVMVTEGKEPSVQDYTEACEIAAYYSSATADAAEVDYTRVKNVKKPPAAKPGFVIYKTNFSAYVQRKKPIGKK